MSKVSNFIRRNDTSLLSGAAIVGVFTTGILSFKAGYVVGHDDGINWETGQGGDWIDDRRERAEYYVRRHWKTTVPSLVSGTATMSAILLSNRAGARHTAAATAAYAVVDQALDDYREKVVEKFGEKADGEVMAEVAQKRTDANQPQPEAIVITGGGNQLCQEAYTGRYFLSDMETLRRAQNDLNAMLISQDACTLSEWYHLVGLSTTSHDHDLGWNADKLMELEFSAVITEDGRPCMVFEYNYVRPLFG